MVDEVTTDCQNRLFNCQAITKQRLHLLAEMAKLTVFLGEDMNCFSMIFDLTTYNLTYAELDK